MKANDKQIELMGNC